MSEGFKTPFIDLCLRTGALSYGRFVLKSGRESPYFFNSGVFNDGAAIAALGRSYAAAIIDSGIEFDMLFGPAYKGIPLVVATAAALATEFARPAPFAFNRKEAKDHGEGGRIVGRALEGRVAIIDDVITAGTAVRESVALIRHQGAEATALVLALDRQERGVRGDLSAVQEIAAEFDMRVVSIVGLADLLEHAVSHATPENLLSLRQYRDRYGVLDPLHD